MERRIRLLVEYDGTDFAGFQIQGQGERTVQGTLEETIERLSGRFQRVHGAGRTDAGVHATGQVVHFDTEWRVPIDRMAIALNTALARDIAVKSAVEAPGFHARYDATARVYRYVILNREAPSALLQRFVLHLREPLNVEAMRQAAAELVGVHDFAAFGQPDAPGKSTTRHVSRISVKPWKDCLLITVRGNAFLRQMVRAMVGTLVQAGQGRVTADDVRRILSSRDRALCPAIAPAKGLFLVRVEYHGVRYQPDSGDDDTTNTEI
ncbi:MAG: tRNA pseudouridine(38-40) synthase TruA [Armatimonadaceae bacterium]